MQKLITLEMIVTCDEDNSAREFWHKIKIGEFHCDDDKFDRAVVDPILVQMITETVQKICDDPLLSNEYVLTKTSNSSFRFQEKKSGRATNHRISMRLVEVLAEKH